ncbi:MAG: hypothetical protein QM817_32930 [Archangium sp.]
MRKPIKTKLTAVLLGATLLLPAVANADVYMHNPRGSNDDRIGATQPSAADIIIEWVRGFF